MKRINLAMLIGFAVAVATPAAHGTDIAYPTLEEVVGEIIDETDITEELIKRIGKNQILVSGRTEVRKINEFLKVEFDEEEQNTISGLIQQKLEHIPSIGEELYVHGCRIIVRDADEKSIKSVQIQRQEEPTGELQSEEENSHSDSTSK